MRCKVGLAGAAGVLAGVPVINFILAPTVGIAVPKGGTLGNAAARALTGFRRGAGSGCPIVPQRIFNNAFGVCNLGAGGSVLVKLTASAFVIRRVARRGAGGGFFCHRG